MHSQTNDRFPIELLVQVLEDLEEATQTAGMTELSLALKEAALLAHITSANVQARKRGTVERNVIQISDFAAS